MRNTDEYGVKSSAVTINDFTGSGEKGVLDVCEGLTCTASGSLSVRGRRAVIRPLTNAQGIYADDTLAYVDNGRLYYGGNEISGIYLTTGEKQILRLGSYLMIFPDEVYVNVADTTDHGTMSVSYICGDDVYVCVTDNEFNEITGYGVAGMLPDAAETGDTCAIKNSDGTFSMYRYEGDAWVNIEAYVRISAPGIGAGFAIGDTVSCEGLGENVGDHFKIKYKSANALYYTGAVPSAFAPSGAVIKRAIPVFDFCDVSGGRLYGVRRGRDKSGSLICKIYASAENDPFNFSPYGGGTECSVDVSGAFTAICGHEGRMLAFTESEIIETRIKNGVLIASVTKGYGVEKGAQKSTVSYGGAVYYKSSAGICEYDGSFPECISKGYKSRIYRSANGCAAVCADGKYYIFATDINSKEAIYVYDIDKNTWFTQDAPDIIAFAKRNELVYALCSDKLILMSYDDADANEKSYCTTDGYPVLEDTPEWRMETHRIYDKALKSVSPTKLYLNAHIGSDTAAYVGVIYSSENEISGAVKLPIGIDGVVTLPLIPKRSDALRVVLYGKGDAEIRSFRLEYRSGGEVTL